MRKLLCVGLLLLPVVSFAGEMKDNVIDQDAKSVVDARGNCVRTKWDGGYGDCNGAQPSAGETQATVYFNFDKDALRSDARAELDSLLQSVTVSGETEATVTGYADRIGDASYNQELSQRRAVAVENYLAQNGVSTVNTSVRARGEAGSVTNCHGDMATGDLIRCLQEDRRVEISISN